MNEDLAIPLVEACKPVQQLGAALVRHGGRLGGRSRVPRGRRRDAQREPAPATGGPPSVARLVRDDLEQPGPKRRAVPEAIEGAVRLHEAVLYRLLGVARIPRCHERDAKGESLVHAYELLVGGRVAALGAHDERCLVQWSAPHSLLLHLVGRSGSASFEPVDNGWTSLRIDEVAPITVAGELRWRPIRRALGVEAFGINAYVAENAGDDVVERHTEERLGHQEVYTVLSGRATFELDDETLDAPAGTVVFVRDPRVRRYARAEEPGTSVLAVGGKSGEAYTPSAWEWYFEAERFRDPLDPEAALRLLEEANEMFPDHVGVLYSTACWQALDGRPDDAWATLQRAMEFDPRTREWARTAEDLVSIRHRL
jgi:mannose-6-phosphate isomerase-like protein (cupin superfamily)